MSCDVYCTAVCLCVAEENKKMKQICLFIIISLFSWGGWALGASWGIMTAYWISFFGSLIGVVLGVLFNRKFFDY